MEPGILKPSLKDGDATGYGVQDISARAGGGVNSTFHYNRFFAIGLFRLLELAGGSDPSTLEKVRRRRRRWKGLGLW